MSSLVDMITQQLGGSMMGQLSRQIGADEKTTGAATGAAVAALLGALARNASQTGGAESLHKALEKDHDGSLLDNLGGFLGNPQSGPGDGILRHVLGGKRPAVEKGIGQTTGMDSAAVGKLLMTVAPIVMGALGKAQRQGGMDTNALSGFLVDQKQELEKREPAGMNLLGSILDTDGDGDFDISDIAKHGAGLLGKLFNK